VDRVVVAHRGGACHLQEQYRQGREFGRNEHFECQKVTVGFANANAAEIWKWMAAGMLLVGHLLSHLPVAAAETVDDGHRNEGDVAPVQVSRIDFARDDILSGNHNQQGRQNKGMGICECHWVEGFLGRSLLGPWFAPQGEETHRFAGYQS
jgi:hypothetical protein